MKNSDRAKKYLKTTNASEVHLTSDGFPFTRKQDALAHAKSLKDKEVTTYTPESVLEETPKADSTAASTEVKFTDQSVEKIKEALAEVTDVPTLQGYVDEETKGKNRSTAIDAIQDRIEELTEPEK